MSCSWSQNGVGAAQSALVAHAMHRPRGPHTFVAGVPAQSAFVVHCTQVESDVLHLGMVAGHCVSAVHPARHRKSSGSHMGAETPQSALERHCTHTCCAGRHRGAAAGQSVFAMHWTHCDVTESQPGFVAGQSVFVLQPLQTPFAVLQRGASFGQPALFVHAAWQVWSAGKHAGAATPQSVFVRHALHLPVPAMQNGADAGHWVSAVHSTQPSVGSHWRPGPHWLVPLTPHAALPPPGPPVVTSEEAGLAPPHAATTAMMTATLAKAFALPSFVVMAVEVLHEPARNGLDVLPTGLVARLAAPTIRGRHRHPMCSGCLLARASSA
jgi:hypothetical protein